MKKTINKKLIIMPIVVILLFLVPLVSASWLSDLFGSGLPTNGVAVDYPCLSGGNTQGVCHTGYISKPTTTHYECNPGIMDLNGNCCADSSNTIQTICQSLNGRYNYNGGCRFDCSAYPLYVEQPLDIPVIQDIPYVAPVVTEIVTAVKNVNILTMMQDFFETFSFLSFFNMIFGLGV